MLGVHFSYNNKLEHEMNFQSHIVKIESVLMFYIIIIAIIIIIIDHVCYQNDLVENQFLYYSSGIVYPYLSDLIW